MSILTMVMMMMMMEKKKKEEQQQDKERDNKMAKNIVLRPLAFLRMVVEYGVGMGLGWLR